MVLSQTIINTFICEIKLIEHITNTIIIHFKFHLFLIPECTIPSGNFLLAAEVPAVTTGGFVFLERTEEPLLE